MEKKGIRMFSRMAEFEAFVNSPDVEVITIQIQVVQQDIQFQESFCALVYFKVVPVVSPSEENTAEQILRKHFDEDWPEDKGVRGTDEAWEDFKKEQSVFVNSMLKAMTEYGNLRWNKAIEEAKEKLLEFGQGQAIAILDQHLKHTHP